MRKYAPRLTLKRAMVLVALAAMCFAFVSAVMNGVRQAKSAANFPLCVNNLKVVGLALHNHHQANDALPFGTMQGTKLPPEKRLGWMFVVIPYVEQLGGSLDYDKDSPWDSPYNLPMHLVGTDRDNGKPFRRPMGDFYAFECPSDFTHNKPHQISHTNFTGIAGLGLDAPTLPQGHPRAGVFGYDRATKFSDITDGLSNTMIVAETLQNNGPWTAGGAIAVRGLDPAKPPYIGGKKGQFGGIHPGGANVLMADGSVKFICDTISPKTFEALSTISGGEITPGWPLP